MLIFDKQFIGNRLFVFRKKAGLTQIEMAELANVSDRTYADIERGEVNMRLDTLLKICNALNITPDALVVEEIEDITIAKIEEKLEHCSNRTQKCALQILNDFLSYSIDVK